MLDYNIVLLIDFENYAQGKPHNFWPNLITVLYMHDHNIHAATGTTNLMQCNVQ